MAEFHPGELFEFTFETSRGHVGMLAEIAIENEVLWLKDVVIEPLAAAKLKVDSREVFAARRQLMELARSAGFRVLRITAERLTGANVGKRVDVSLDLTK